jgi:hypothetical protein
MKQKQKQKRKKIKIGSRRKKQSYKQGVGRMRLTEEILKMLSLAVTLSIVFSFFGAYSPIEKKKNTYIRIIRERNVSLRQNFTEKQLTEVSIVEYRLELY